MDTNLKENVGLCNGVHPPLAQWATPKSILESGVCAQEELAISMGHSN